MGPENLAIFSTRSPLGCFGVFVHGGILFVI